MINMGLIAMDMIGMETGGILMEVLCFVPIEKMDMMCGA